MPGFHSLITPEQAKRFHDEANPGDKKSLAYWRRRARITAFCSVCESEPVWKWSGGDLCFSCTTGEADPSDDYELA